MKLKTSIEKRKWILSTFHSDIEMLAHARVLLYKETLDTFWLDKPYYNEGKPDYRVPDLAKKLLGDKDEV